MGQLPLTCKKLFREDVKIPAVARPLAPTSHYGRISATNVVAMVQHRHLMRNNSLIGNKKKKLQMQVEVILHKNTNRCSSMC